MEITTTSQGVTVINDTYNANPTSMKAAINSLASLPCSGAKIAYLGVMAELGDRSSNAHLEVKEYAEELGDEVVAVATELYGASRVLELEDVLAEIEKKNLGKDDALLFKSSRIVGLEKVVRKIIT